MNNKYCEYHNERRTKQTLKLECQEEEGCVCVSVKWALPSSCRFVSKGERW